MFVYGIYIAGGRWRQRRSYVHRQMTNKCRYITQDWLVNFGRLPSLTRLGVVQNGSCKNERERYVAVGCYWWTLMTLDHLLAGRMMGELAAAEQQRGVRWLPRHPIYEYLMAWYLIWPAYCYVLSLRERGSRVYIPWYHGSDVWLQGSND